MTSTHICSKGNMRKRESVFAKHTHATAYLAGVFFYVVFYRKTSIFLGAQCNCPCHLCNKWYNGLHHSKNGIICLYRKAY